MNDGPFCSDSELNGIKLFGEDSVFTRLIEEVENTHTEFFDIFYERELLRRIVYRDHDIEAVVRDIFNNKIILPKEISFSIMDQHRDLAFKTLVIFIKEMKEKTKYEDAIKHLKEVFNYNLIDYKPEEDGITHINVYSKGKTKLGQLLSNFAHTPFEHPEYGHFSSVEAFWYWYMFYLTTGEHYEKLRGLYGYASKKAGLEIRASLKNMKNPVTEGSLVMNEDQQKRFRIEIKKALLLKIEQNEEVRTFLRDSTLPLIHYYAYGNENGYKITYPFEFKWITDYLETIRLYLNGKAHKVIIAGSRDIKDYNDVVSVLRDHPELKIVEVVSGCARGVDKLGEQYAYENEIPCALFPVTPEEWKTIGKGAGHIRNKKMGDYATYGVLIHNGQSPGTKNMKEVLEQQNKPFIYITIL